MTPPSMIDYLTPIESVIWIHNVSLYFDINSTRLCCHYTLLLNIKNSYFGADTWIPKEGKRIVTDFFYVFDALARFHVDIERPLVGVRLLIVPVFPMGKFYVWVFLVAKHKMNDRLENRNRNLK